MRDKLIKPSFLGFLKAIIQVSKSAKSQFNVFHIHGRIARKKQTSGLLWWSSG